MSTDSMHTQYVSPPITIILTIVLLVFFFLGFFSIYFCRCFMESIADVWHLRGRSPSGTPVGIPTTNLGLGLDPSIIEAFPKFLYSTVKDLRKEKYGLECAICLSEFADDDLLRLLTDCCHVFHQECIDLWLECHKTCPVCRRSLDEAEQSPLKSPPIVVNNATSSHDTDEQEQEQEQEQGHESDSFSIAIKEDEEERRARRINAVELEHNAGHDKAERFSRSNSTGHSIISIRGGELDKYTLRLPEHVREDIARGHHNWTKSWTTFGDYLNNAPTTNGGFGEASGFSGEDINKE